jgi:hypothetical protein
MRAILDRVFSVAVPTIYHEDESGPPERERLIPLFPRPAELGMAEYPAWAREQSDLLVTKTHEMPDDGTDPAIVLIRDGRAAMASYERFLGNFGNDPRELEEIVIGRDTFASWSDWNRAWLSRSAPTLLLRYEEVTRDPASTIAALSNFLSIAPRNSFDLTFEQMQADDPQFFSIGNNEPGIHLIEERCPNLFWILHGEEMETLGYCDTGSNPMRNATWRGALDEVSAALRRVKTRPTG